MATLISVIGFKVYDFLSNLSYLAVPSEKTYATIPKNHYVPKTLVIAKRYRFHHCI